MNRKFQGVYPVVVTPFNEDGSFDFEAAKKHADFLIDGGIKGALIFGATSEYQSVNLEEHKQYTAVMVPYLKEHGLSVIVGCSREMPDEVIELMNHDQSCGADAAMVLSPFYCHPNQTEILENYRYIAGKTTLPLMIYNNPFNSGVNIGRDTMKEIFKLPAAQILKESTTDIHRLSEACQDAPEYTSIFCGDEYMPVESYVMGACGWISMSANFQPKSCVKLNDLLMTGKIDEAKELYYKMRHILELLENIEKVGATVKYILKKYKGIDAGAMRRPRVGLTEAEMKYVDEVMAQGMFE